MTIVEIILFFAALAAIYYLMKPLQKRLEFYLLKIFKSKKHGRTIDITDYAKKDKNGKL